MLSYNTTGLTIQNTVPFLKRFEYFVLMGYMVQWIANCVIQYHVIRRFNEGTNYYK